MYNGMNETEKDLESFAIFLGITAIVFVSLLIAFSDPDIETKEKVVKVVTICKEVNQ